MPVEKDVVISWFAGIKKSQRLYFSRPTHFIEMPTPAERDYSGQLVKLGWPHPLRGILANYASGIKPLRIAVMGFSEGCTGVTGILRSKDAGFIDTAIAIDGIHSPFIGGNKNNIAVAGVAPWIEYAKIASTLNPDPGNNLPIGRRTAIITHSAIVPPNYASTTQTAKIILDSIFGSGNWPQEPIPSGISDVVYEPELVLNGNNVNNHTKTAYPNAPIKYVSHKLGMYVFGFNNIDPSGVNDHIYQANVVLPQVVSQILIPNWNNIDPNVAACYPTSSPSFTSSYLGVLPGCDPNAATKIPPAVADPSTPESLLPDGSLNYDKWIPQDEKNAEKTQKVIKKIETMSTYAKLLFLLTGGLLLYAGTKTTQAISEAEEPKSSR